MFSSLEFLLLLSFTLALLLNSLRIINGQLELSFSTLTQLRRAPVAAASASAGAAAKVRNTEVTIVAKFNKDKE